MQSLLRSKRIIGTVAGLVALSVPLSLGVAPAANAAPAPDIKVTQNYSDTVAPLTGVSCNDGITVSDTQYWRRFDLSVYGAANGFSVSKMTMGVELAESTAGNVPGSFSVYALDHAATLTVANLGTPLATVPVNYDSVADGALLTAAIAATIPAGKDLVIKAAVNDSTTDELFFPGANEDPELAPTYLSSVACGTAEPTPVEDLVGAPLASVLYVGGKTTDCKTAETAVTTATAAAAAAATKVTTATKALKKAAKKVKKAKKALKKAEQSGDNAKVAKAKKALKKAKKAKKAKKKALASAKAALTAANAAVTAAQAAQNTKCAQPVLPPAPPRPSQDRKPVAGSNGTLSFSSAR